MTDRSGLTSKRQFRKDYGNVEAIGDVRPNDWKDVLETCNCTCTRLITCTVRRLAPTIVHFRSTFPNRFSCRSKTPPGHSCGVRRSDHIGGRWHRNGNARPGQADPRRRAPSDGGAAAPIGGARRGRFSLRPQTSSPLRPFSRPRADGQWLLPPVKKTRGVPPATHRRRMGVALPSPRACVHWQFIPRQGHRAPELKI